MDGKQIKGESFVNDQFKKSLVSGRPMNPNNPRHASQSMNN